MTNDQWMDDFCARLEHNEGVRLSMYRDTLGNRTIGVGFNLERPDWETALTAAGVPSGHLEIRDGDAELTVAQVGALLKYSVQPILAQARALLEPTHFDNMSDARRTAFADLTFNMGADELRRFFGFRGMMDQGCHDLMTVHDPVSGHAMFARAAADLLSTPYAKQVGARAQRNAAMIASSGYVDVAAFEG